MATAERAQQRLDAPKGSPDPPAKLAAQHAVTRRTVGDFACYSVAPRSGQPTHAVLFLHGGSYIGEIKTQHWSFVDHLVTAGARVEVPIYGLAPQHTYREAYPLITAVYRDLTADAAAGPVSIVGDSAGAGLALGFTQSLEAAGLPLPARVTLISPWLDLTLSNPGIPEVERRDLWLSRAGLLVAAAAWAGGDDPTDYRLSPINSTMTGLPPIEVYVGTHDILYPDTLRLRDCLSAMGAPVRLTVAPGAFHDYVLAPVPEGKQATRAIVQGLIPA